MERLWTRNFTILTIGSFISALGSAAASVAFGILIYQRTGSPLTLALFTVANIVPRIITGFLAGPFVDRHSRRKTVYRLDYLSSMLFFGIAFILFTGYFDVLVFTLLAGVFGIIDTVYQLSFMSMFPEVITRGNHSRAYSLSSLIWPLSAAMMAPIAAFMIDQIVYGIAILMAFNAVTHFIAASVESTIRLDEKLNQKKVSGLQFVEDLKEGFHYYKLEKGIFGIAILFAAFSFVFASHDLLRMPYFINSDVYTLQHFSFLITAASVGRIIGGIVHYTFKYPPHKRYLIAVSVYLTVELLSATMLYMPYVLMITVSFIVGLLSVTSFNIRMTATQVYIPTELRGRVNSTQNLLWHVGGIAGVLTAGFIAEYTTLDYRFILLLLASVSLTTILMVPIRMHHEFKKIYNADI
jgi:MFS family permease